MGSCHAVPESSVDIVESFGKFEGVKKPGFYFIIFYKQKVGEVNLRIKQLNVNVNTKTKDNVFVSLSVAVQMRVIPDDTNIYNAFYKLGAPDAQVGSMVEDVARSVVPTIDLDELFISKHAIAQNVKERLKEELAGYGYELLDSLVIDIVPDSVVKRSMNEMNASRRKRLADAEIAEAERISSIKKAEAESEALALRGDGTSRQRAAIIDGLKDSVENFTPAGSTPAEAQKMVFNLLLITQYFDALKTMSAGGGNVVFTKRSSQSSSRTFTSS